MTFSITGVTATPDVGFKFGSRHTAEGARNLAMAFIVAGLQEVEVRDGRGNVRSLRELSIEARENPDDDHRLAERLAAL